MNERPIDKIDSYHREQLSALADGELGPEEARFLLRRLQHDPELASCQERWQLLGDAMRGQACAPAPHGFAERVAAAVAVEPAPPLPARGAAAGALRRRGGWLGWGGGAALAASVAAVALFMGRSALEGPQPGDAPPLQVVSSEAVMAPAAAPGPAVSAPVTDASADPAIARVAAAPAAAAAVRRGSATRTQQAARVAQRNDLPERAVANQAPMVPALQADGSNATMPFGNVGTLQAKPWPRSTLGGGDAAALNASYPASGQAGFYPFEPRLQDPQAAPARRD